MACCLLRLAAWWACCHIMERARAFTHLPWQRVRAVMLLAGERGHPPAWARGAPHPGKAAKG
eukprot:13208461-Alexandrium_andersonii.AAC.1